jgi:hypothetical protein
MRNEIGSRRAWVTQPTGNGSVMRLPGAVLDMLAIVKSFWDYKQTLGRA